MSLGKLNQNCTYGDNAVYEYHEDATSRGGLSPGWGRNARAPHPSPVDARNRVVLCVALVARRDVCGCRVDKGVVNVPEARLVAHVQQLRVRQPHWIEHTVAVEAGQLPRTAWRNDHLPTRALLEPRHHQRSAIPRLYTQFQWTQVYKRLLVLREREWERERESECVCVCVRVCVCVCVWEREREREKMRYHIGVVPLNPWKVLSVWRNSGKSIEIATAHLTVKEKFYSHKIWVLYIILC